MSDYTSAARALFAACDTLQIPIEADATTIEAKIQKISQVGPIKMSFPMIVKTDMVKGPKVGLLVHFRGDLWGYLYSYDSDGESDLWIALFDGKDLTFASIKTGDPLVTINKLGNRVKGFFLYTGSAWAEVQKEMIFPSKKTEGTLQ